ncbi:MAG: DUF6798 domain-containing protein [Candidatus Woesearchaeota archaeon]
MAKEKPNKDRLDRFIDGIIENKYLILLIISAAAIFLVLYRNYGNYSHRQYLPFLYRMISPEYLINDWYVNLNTGFNVRTYFINVVSFTYNVFSLFISSLDKIGVTLFFLNFIFCIGTLINFYFLAKYFYGDKKYAYIFALFLLFSIQISYIGDDYPLDSQITPNQIAWFFVFLSLNLILRGKIAFGFFVLGISALFQSVIASITFFIFFSKYMVEMINFRKPFIEDNLKTIIKTAPFFIISLFNIIPTLFTTNELIDQDKITYIVAQFRHTVHSFPSAMGIEKYALTISLFLAFFICLRYSEMQSSRKREIYLMLLPTTVFIISGYMFVEIFPIAIIAKAQFFRVFSFIIPFLYLVVLNEIMADYHRYQSPMIKLALIALIISFLYSPKLIICLTLLYCVFKIMKKSNYRAESPAILKFIIILGIMILLAGITVCYPKIIEYVVARIYFFYKLSAILIIFLINLIIYLYDSNLKKRHVFVLISIMALISLTYVYLVPFAGREGPSEDMLATCRYVKENLPKDTILLTSPAEPNWRLCLNRAIVVDLEAIPFKDSSMVEWYERLIYISGNHLKEYDKSITSFNLNYAQYYDTLNETEILRLKEKYGFDYIIFKTDARLNFKSIYANEVYAVYSLKEPYAVNTEKQ